MMRAGLTTTMPPSGTDRVTTAPAPTMARGPIVMPGSPTPDRCTSHNNRAGKVLGILFAAGVFVVVEGHIRPDKYIVTHPQAVPQLHATLDRHAVADDHIVFGQAVGTYIPVLLDLGTRQHDDEFPASRAAANSRGLDIRQGVNIGLGHPLNALIFIAVDVCSAMG